MTPKKDMNNLSLSQTIFAGKPFSQYHSSKNTTANSSADRSVWVATICISDPSQSVIVKIQSFPSSSGNGPMKSMAIDSQWELGTGKGCRGPEGLPIFDFNL